jgi:hypothetical protein
MARVKCRELGAPECQVMSLEEGTLWSAAFRKAHTALMGRRPGQPGAGAARSAPSPPSDRRFSSNRLASPRTAECRRLAALGRVLPPATTQLDMVVVTGGEEAAVNGLGGLPAHYTLGTVVTPGDLNPGGNQCRRGTRERRRLRARGRWRRVVVRQGELALSRLHRPRHHREHVRQGI